MAGTGEDFRNALRQLGKNPRFTTVAVLMLELGICANSMLTQGLRMTAVGLGLGLLVSTLLTRFLRGLLYGVSATDPSTVVCVTILLLAIAAVTCLLPALKAAHVDPVAAIREQ